MWVISLVGLSIVGVGCALVKVPRLLDRVKMGVQYGLGQSAYKYKRCIRRVCPAKKTARKPMRKPMRGIRRSTTPMP